MVGVPGRSKACNTCRRRRVGCDETKPLCHRCIRGGFECLGYERPTQWRHTSTAPLPASAARASDSKQPPAPAPVSMGAAPAQQIDLSAFREGVCAAFASRNFVWRTYGTLWLDQAAKGKLGNLSLQAANALSQLSFGLCNRVQDVELKGARLYGTCLRTLAEELGKEPSMVRRGQELMVPILILMMHSSMQRDKTAAAFHLRAVAKVLSLCGPGAFQQQPLRNAFEAARSTLLIASLFSRRRIFLEYAHWQTIPWALDPSEKSPQSHLLDILLVIPGLLEDYSRLNDAEFEPCDELADPDLFLDKRSIRHSVLCSRISAQLEKLYRWRWEWQHRFGRYVTVDPFGWQSNGSLAIALGSTGNSRILDRLHFDRPVYANDITLYNAALIWLISLLWKLEPSEAATIIEECANRVIPSSDNLRPPPSDIYNIHNPKIPSQYTSFEPLRRPGASVSIRDPAMEICRVYEWQSRHHEQHAASGDQTCLYLFPVGMARSVLEAESDGRKWIQTMLSSNPITAGYGREAENIVGFGFYITKRALDPDFEGVEDDVEEIGVKGARVI